MAKAWLEQLERLKLKLEQCAGEQLLAVDIVELIGQVRSRGDTRRIKSRGSTYRCDSETL